MNLRVLSLAIILALATPTVAVADGFLPPNAYHYLHPPPALAATNKPPQPGLRVLPVDYLRGVGWGAFTPDTQAGVTGIRNSLTLSKAATAVVIRIDPVDIPPGLPDTLAPDGNAYRFTFTEQPGGRHPGFRVPLRVVLRYPHLPLAIYHYTGNGWNRTCYSDQAIVTSFTIGCPIRQEGIYIVMTSPSSVGSSNAPSTPFSRLNPYIPVLAAIALIIAAVILGFIVTRPARPQRRGTRR